MKSKPIKLTGNSYAVMALLSEFGESTSYEIKQALEKSIENFWPVPHTTAYEEPARLATAGYLEARQEEAGRRRRVYSLTDQGRQALAEWTSDPVAAAPQLRDEVMLKVFAGADPGALVAGRIEWHRRKLEELRGYIDEVEEADGFPGSARTLLAGVAYHEKMLELIDQLRAAAETSPG
jgi:PadR family transcriptional regulator AphA